MRIVNIAGFDIRCIPVLMYFSYLFHDYSWCLSKERMKSHVPGGDEDKDVDESAPPMNTECSENTSVNKVEDTSANNEEDALANKEESSLPEPANSSTDLPFADADPVPSVETSSTSTENNKLDENHHLYPTVDMSKVHHFHNVCSKTMQHYHTEKKILECIMDVLQKMEEKVKALNREKDFLNNKLTKALPNVLNFFVILLEHFALHSPTALTDALPLLCKTIAQLPVSYHALLALYWKSYSAKNLLTLVEHLQQLICFQVRSFIVLFPFSHICHLCHY